MNRVLPSLLLLCLSRLAISSTFTSPALLWGSGDYVNHSPNQLGLQYVPELTDSSDIFSAVQDGKGSQIDLNLTRLAVDADKLVTVYVLSKLQRSSLAYDTSDLRKSVEDAPSSLYLANLQTTQNEIAEKVRSSSGTELLQIGSCDSESQSLNFDVLQQRLLDIVGSISVLVCDNEQSSLSLGLESYLKENGRPYLFIYTGQNDEEFVRPPARILQASSNANKDKWLCSAKCQAQVRLFEVIILLVILLWALYIGMNMLHILDTPSRFEVEKKDQNRHQD